MPQFNCPPCHGSDPTCLAAAQSMSRLLLVQLRYSNFVVTTAYFYPTPTESCPDSLALPLTPYTKAQDMSSRPFERPLLPVPSAVASPVGNTIRPRIKKASLACTECRKRKSKAMLSCVGLPPPCERCRRQKIECILDEESDRRRRGVLERRLDVLEQDRTLLVRLVDIIRDGSQEEASRVLNYIRSDASLDDIRRFLAQSPSPSEAEHVPRQRFSPLYHVPAWPWTSVTDDSNYISHLISIYFSWNSPVLKWIERDLFIRDMQSGNIDSPFCSPFLVNAILAVACCYCDVPETNSASDVVPPGRLDFFDEAKRLLGQEEGKFSLTSFQGRSASTWIMGKHMLSWQYLVEIADCARQLQARRNAIAVSADEKAQELLLALDTAITGSFSALSIFPSLHKASIMPKPTLYDLRPRHHTPKDVWWPYGVEDGSPAMPVPIPAHSNCVSTELLKLQLVLWEISNNPFQSIGQLCCTKEEMAEIFHQRLKQWVTELPECLTHASLLDSASTPAVLDMHLSYHSAVINVFEDIKTANDPYSPLNEVQAIRLSSARIICSLLEIFGSRWSVHYMPFIYIRYANIALSILLVDLDNAENRGHFINSYTSLHALSIRLPIAKEVLQLIVEQARQKQTELPKEVLCLS
ncbi:hypothetical protein AN6062.2 [Aspergillus nidulans FGSC A4]|nr:hypothetical protein AN6062.2 [Aspergillus nidulans FGSC A4]|eukprot:XP_663666.1 hypothetical protein AN6062.2 [Aspergillus nidulans FGSC A4]